MTTAQSMHGSRHAPAPPTSWPRLLGVIIGLVALLTLILTAFAWPAVNTATRDVPIVVTGLPSFVEQVREPSTRRTRVPSRSPWSTRRRSPRP